MKKTLFFLFFILVCTSLLGYAQEQRSVIVDPPEIQAINTTEDVESQGINQDEGYGADDQEYYEAEGLNTGNATNEK